MSHECPPFFIQFVSLLLLLCLRCPNNSFYLIAQVAINRAIERHFGTGEKEQIESRTIGCGRERARGIANDERQKVATTVAMWCGVPHYKHIHVSPLQEAVIESNQNESRDKLRKKANGIKRKAYNNAMRWIDRSICRTATATAHYLRESIIGSCTKTIRSPSDI